MTGGLLRRFLSAMMENSDMKILAAGKIGDGITAIPKSVSFNLSTEKTTFTYCFGGSLDDKEAVLKGAGTIFPDTGSGLGYIAKVTSSSISIGDYDDLSNILLVNFIVFEIDE